MAISAVGDTWIVKGHEAVRRCALDTEAFSNRVSRRLQIPNGLDGEEHRRFRRAVDAFFTPVRMLELAPVFAAIAGELIRALPRGRAVEVVEDIGSVWAVRAQCAWLGWPPQLEPRLLGWMAAYRSAMRGSDIGQRAAVAAGFDAIVLEQLAARRDTATGPGPADVTAQLMAASVEEPSVPGGRRPLTHAEVTSILRNWTAGDLGTIAACVGVVLHRVASDPVIQAGLRRQLHDTAALDAAIDECLRMEDPFVFNRRTATRDTDVAGHRVPAGAKVLLNWADANRDPLRFDAPDTFRPEQNAAHNLVYGIGPHVCPGRQLATLQLRAMLSALLRDSAGIELAEPAPSRDTPPSGGFASVWIVLRSAAPHTP